MKGLLPIRGSSSREENVGSGPQVGTFWGLRAQLGSRTILHASVPLIEAEAYGDCLTYPLGHCEDWEAWRRLGSAELGRRGIPPAMREHEYDAVPRGRIVYRTDDQHFILYADRKLQAPVPTWRIIRLFSLPEGQVRVCSDAHYPTPAVG